MTIPANNEQGNLIAVGSPIVLQRRGSVYGANVPMITGICHFFFLFYILNFNYKVINIMFFVFISICVVTQQKELVAFLID